MKKIGILFGMENTFPSAFVDKVNSMEIEGISAEFVHLGGVTMAEPCGYDVIVDRISHDMPFYRAYLKNAALTGTQIINNPFWWSADDKFFNYALASKLGRHVILVVEKASELPLRDRRHQVRQHRPSWPRRPSRPSISTPTAGLSTASAGGQNWRRGG